MYTHIHTHTLKYIYTYVRDLEIKCYKKYTIRSHDLTPVLGPCLLFLLVSLGVFYAYSLFCSLFFPYLIPFWTTSKVRNKIAVSYIPHSLTNSVLTDLYFCIILVSFNLHFWF